MKIISVIGYSGTGKTCFITKAIQLLKERFNFEIAVIKNIHEHQIDRKDKDTYRFGEAGVKFSITKNVNNETTIFLKTKISVEDLLKWLELSPYKIELCFLEGFRNLTYPTVLCVKNREEIKLQLTELVKMISGLISLDFKEASNKIDVPVVNLLEGFESFLKIFEIN